MTTERIGDAKTGESGIGENPELEGLGAKLDEYSAWYNFVFSVF